MLIRFLQGLPIALLLAVLTLRSWDQQMVWLNDKDLWLHVIKHNPKAKGAYNNLATALHRTNNDSNYVDAYVAAYTATKTDSNNYRTHATLGRILNKMRLYEEAEIALRRSIEIYPHKSIVHYDLSRSLLGQGRCKEARESYLWTFQFDFSARQRLLLAFYQDQQMLVQLDYPCSEIIGTLQIPPLPR